MAGTGKEQGLILRALIAAQGHWGVFFLASAAARRQHCALSHASALLRLTDANPGRSCCFKLLPMVLQVPSVQEPLNAEELFSNSNPLTSSDSGDGPMTGRAVSYGGQSGRVQGFKIENNEANRKEPLESIPIYVISNCSASLLQPPKLDPGNMSRLRVERRAFRVISFCAISPSDGFFTPQPRVNLGEARRFQNGVGVHTTRDVKAIIRLNCRRLRVLAMIFFRTLADISFPQSTVHISSRRI